MVVTYNSAHCIAPLAAGLGGLPHVVVVDNASADDTREQVAKHLPKAQCIALSANAGYGVANNCGLETVSTEFALLLNPDCVIDAEQIAELVRGALSQPDATLVVPQLTDASGELQVNYSWPRHFWKPRSEAASGPLNVGYACAAVMLVQMKHLAALGGAFDPLFFLYYEDEDLCLRVFEAQQQILVLPQIRITHLARGSVKGPHPWRAEYWRGYHHVQSKILFTWKHFGADAATALKRRTMVLAAAAVAVRLLLLSPKHVARAWGRLNGLLPLRIDGNEAHRTSG